MIRRLLLPAALVGALVGALLGAAAGVAAPAHAAIDPRCAEVFQVTGYITVRDTSTAPAGLAPQVTVDDMSCVIDLISQPAYVYLDEPFAKLTTMAASFAADGWRIQQVLDDGTEVPFDLATLPAFESAQDFMLMATRGPDGAAIYYSVDDELSDFFAAGLFVITNPLIGGEPAAGGTGIDDPSAISELRSIAAAAPNPTQTGVLVLVASLLTLLLGFPAYLLSTVLSSRYAQWFAWLERGAVGRLRERVAGARSRWRWPMLLGGMALASLIAGFIDPRFGFNLLSVRLFLTLFATFAIFNVGAWAVIRLVLRRVDSSAKAELSFHPATLLVVTIAVVLSRVLGFDPGILFGLVAGVSFGVALALSREALVVLVGSGYAAAVGLLAWVGYSVLGAQQQAGLVALSEFLGGLTLEGVSTLPIALIPLAALDGATLFRWKRWAWGIAYAVGVALFMLVLFTMPGDGGAFDGGFLRWTVIFVVFAIVAVGVWAADWAVRRRTEPSPAA